MKLIVTLVLDGVSSNQQVFFRMHLRSYGSRLCWNPGRVSQVWEDKRHVTNWSENTPLYSLLPAYNTEVRADLGAQGINSPSAAKCNQTPGVSTLKSSWICVGYRSEHITSFDRWLYFSFQRGRGEGQESERTHAQQSFEYGPRKAGWGIFLSSDHTLSRAETEDFRGLELCPCGLWHWKTPPFPVAIPTIFGNEPVHQFAPHLRESPEAGIYQGWRWTGKPRLQRWCHQFQRTAASLETETLLLGLLAPYQLPTTRSLGSQPLMVLR